LRHNRFDPSSRKEIRLKSLSAIEARFLRMRQRPANLPGAFTSAYTAAVGRGANRPLAGVRRLGLALAAAVDEAAAGQSELAYHSRHHIAETVHSMGWLCGLTRTHGDVSAREAALGVAAMVGHDLGHDGSAPVGGVLEARAAMSVIAIARAQGMLDADCDVLRQVVLGTDPGEISTNAERAAGRLPPGEHGVTVDRICALANEADVFASLLPAIGLVQSRALASEWRAGGYDGAEEVGTFVGRLRFLRLYQHLSPAAEHIGLADVRDRQLAAFVSSGERLRAAVSVDAGAAALDRLSWPEAYGIFMAAFNATAPSRG
jgi:hypothetical protein